MWLAGQERSPPSSRWSACTSSSTRRARRCRRIPRLARPRRFATSSAHSCRRPRCGSPGPVRGCAVTNLDGGRGLPRAGRRLLGRWRSRRRGGAAGAADRAGDRRRVDPDAARSDPGRGPGVRLARAVGAEPRLGVGRSRPRAAGATAARHRGVPGGPLSARVEVGGSDEIGASRAALGARAATLGAGGGQPPPWIGADLLAGAAATLTGLVDTCDELDEGLARQGLTATNEQLLTLAAALGRVTVADLSPLARRIQTGARHGAASAEDAAGARDLAPAGREGPQLPAHRTAARARRGSGCAASSPSRRRR